MHFPSGKIELLEESYLTLEDAKAAGEKLIVEINANERFYSYKDDGLGSSKKQKPRFFVLKIEGRNKEEVYSSK